jgi:hypothetical protein
MILIIIGFIFIRSGGIIFVIIGAVLFIVGICSSRKASKSLDKTPETKTTQKSEATTPPEVSPQKAPEPKVESPKFCSLCGAEVKGEYCTDCGTKIE